MFDSFLESDGPIQIIIAVAIFSICWRAVLSHEPRSSLCPPLHIEKVNFFLLLWLVGTIGSFVYSLVIPVWPIYLAAMSAFAWDFTSLLILTTRSGPRVVRGIIAVPIIAVMLLTAKQEFNMRSFVADVDRVIICGPSVALEKCPVAASTAGIRVGEADAKSVANQEWGGARVKPSSVVRGLYFFLTLFLIFSYYGQIYRRWHQRQERFSAWALDASVIQNLVTIISLSIATIAGLFFAGADLPSLGIFSGLLAAGLSIALRDMLQNSIAGILLIWDKTINKDDVITIGKDQYGWVDRITLRYTVVKDRNDINSLIPNSTLISGTIQNWTQEKGTDGKSNVRLKLDIGVAYDTDVHDAISRMIQAARRVERVLNDPAPQTLVVGPGESAINLQLRFWINEPKKGIRNVLSEIYLEVLKEFEGGEGRNKIVIPYPQREIRVVGQSGQTGDTAQSGQSGLVDA
jgi:small-conductance mechanosensitive channel